MKAKPQAAYVTSDQVSEPEVKELMLQEPSLQGILAPEHAAVLTKWFCTLLNYKATENMANGTLQAARQLPNGAGVASGNSTVQGNGLGSTEVRQDARTKPNEDEMSETDVSTSEAEEEAC